MVTMPAVARDAASDQVKVEPAAPEDAEPNHLVDDQRSAGHDDE